MDNTDEIQELYDAVEAYEEAKAEEEAANRERVARQERLAKLLERAGRKTMTITKDDGTRVRVTRSQSEYVKSVDEKGLKKALGAKVWRTITDTKLSQTKLKAAITAGEVDALTASVYITTALKTASITLSNPKEGDE